MIIFRSLAKEIITTTFSVTLVLLVIFTTNQSLRYFRGAAEGLISGGDLLHIIVLHLPLLLGYLLPLGFYLGVLLTLGRWQLDSEMTILSACGMSRAGITGMVLMIALFVAVLVALLTSIVVPRAQMEINNIFRNAAETASISQVIPDRFMEFGGKHFGSGLTDAQDAKYGSKQEGVDADAPAEDKSRDNRLVFYAHNVGKNHDLLQDVFVAQKIGQPDVKTGAQKWGVVVAKSAKEQLIHEQGNRYLVFQNGYRYSGVPGQKDYRVERFDQYAVRISANSTASQGGIQSYSMPVLWSLSPKNLEAAAELQWRITLPLCAIIFALLAVPLSEVRPRYGKFTHLFPAIMIFAVYLDLILVMRSSIQTGRISPQLGMWWVHGAALLLALGLTLYRVGWHRISFYLRR